jgi:G3E family GTPase
LIDPKDFDDPRWRETQVFYDQIHLADIVVINWSDTRDRDAIDRCRAWVDSFRPPKQLVVEASFGDFDFELLDQKFADIRFPLFEDAHPLPEGHATELTVLSDGSANNLESNSMDKISSAAGADGRKPEPGLPLRFQNEDSTYDACGWIFHVDDIFNRNELLDLLGYVNPIMRLKGIFRCEDNWWMINRAKDGTSYQESAYRRDSRLEIILNQKTSGWKELEAKLLECLIR